MRHVACWNHSAEAVMTSGKGENETCCLLESQRGGGDDQQQRRK